MRFLLLIVLMLCAVPQAHAHPDLSTGSLLISVFVGVFASLALTIRAYWYRLKRFFIDDRDPTDPPPPGDATA